MKTTTRNLLIAGLAGASLLSASAVIAGGGFSLGRATGSFAFISLVGFAIGLAIGFAIGRFVTVLVVVYGTVVRRIRIGRIAVRTLLR